MLPSDKRVFVIAEAGVNHNGEPALAHRLVDAAAEAGADAVKFQSFTAEALVTADAPTAEYQKRADQGATQLAMLKKLELSPELTVALKRHADERGIAFMSTPFDEAAADFLAALPVPILKVGSGELTNVDFLAHLAGKRIPIIVSTGMATLGEIEAALAAIYDIDGDARISLLHCTSSYPAPPESANLRAMATMRQAFGLPVGYSDHTPGIEISVAAVALGAEVIEKHLTIDRSLPGPDHQASLEPGDFAALVRAIRNASAALGDGRKRPAPAERDTARVARRSLVALREIPAGTLISDEMLGVRRPGTGLLPSLRGAVVGMRTTRALGAGEPLTWAHFHARPSTT